jgi:CBS domain containing-hemolysin-like protein
MIDVVILLGLLVLSALFSGSETALTSISRARVEGLAKEGRPGSHALLRLKSNSGQMLISLLIGNNLVNIAASAMATVVAVERFGAMGPGIAVGLLTLVILIFGEVTPKSLALRYSERISLGVAPLILGFRWLVFPLVWALEIFTIWIHRATGTGGDPTVTESELISMVAHGAAEGTIEKEERAFIERVFGFGDLRVKDVMTHRQQIFALNGNYSVREALPEVLEGTFSRIPIYENQPEEIHQLVYLRDILTAVAHKNLDVPLNQIAHEPLYAFENQSIAELFTKLLWEKRHMAIVVDEYGSLQGVVTLEDLLEELVGEIYDETDKAPQEVKVFSENRITVRGTTELRIVEELLHADLPGKPTDTVSAWILASTGRIPQTDEKLIIEGLEVQVEKATHRRIQQVIISRERTAKTQGTGNMR